MSKCLLSTLEYSNKIFQNQTKNACKTIIKPDLNPKSYLIQCLIKDRWTKLSAKKHKYNSILLGLQMLNVIYNIILEFCIIFNFFFFYKGSKINLKYYFFILIHYVY